MVSSPVCRGPLVNASDGYIRPFLATDRGATARSRVVLDIFPAGHDVAAVSNALANRPAGLPLTTSNGPHLPHIWLRLRGSHGPRSNRQLGDVVRMTDDAGAGREATRSDYEAAIGRLSIVSTRLENRIRELGLAVGLDLGHVAYRTAVDLLTTHVDRVPLPPWRESTVTVEAVQSWLKSAAERLSERDNLVAASSIPFIWPPVIFDLPITQETLETTQQGHMPARRTELAPSDYERLSALCEQLATEGMHLYEGLGMRRASGGVLYGYHSICRALYSALTDPVRFRELRPYTGRPADPDQGAESDE
jgi:hypothetical protein